MTMSKNAASKVVVLYSPGIVNRKVFIRRKNTHYRTREYLTEKEVASLISAASKIGRHGVRDSTLIMIAYRHGLRVAELVAIRWDQIDLGQGLIHINRLKNGVPSAHPLRGVELRSLRQLQGINWLMMVRIQEQFSII
jgi:type 1 fimbriae regulatory protein FimE